MAQPSSAEAVDVCGDVGPAQALLQAGTLQTAIFNSANFSSIATDAKVVIQIFNVGAERMLGYSAAEVTNQITPADISDSQEVIARAKALSVELATPITPGFEALVFKASRGIEDIYELTYIRSANAMARDIERGLEAGFFRYLTKPIQIKEFMETLNVALEFAEKRLVQVPDAGKVP